MNDDDLGLFSSDNRVNRRYDRGHPEQRRRPERGRPPRRPVRRQPPPRRKRRTVLWVSMAVVLALIGLGGYIGLREVMGIGDFEDFQGQGQGDVIIEVESGQSTGDIAATLADAGVVASSRAFVSAAESNENVRNVQPGYYLMKKKASGAAAVTRIVDAKNKVGHFEIFPGAQLANITKPNGEVVPGIVGLLAEASCADVNGKSTCVPPEALQETSKTADLAKLGVPDWAIPFASKAEPQRRLEGMIMPGLYDVRPGSTAEELWRQLVGDSATQMQAIDVPAMAKDTGYTPYQIMTMASLIEREAIEKDFKKVSRVTYNRLKESMRLEYDSTINYVLDRPAIRTNSDDREKAGPYNTYENTGLPPTPISAPSQQAIEDAAAPEEGPWLFFVRCQKDGTSCFATTSEEHEANVDQAQVNGAY